MNIKSAKQEIENALRDHCLRVAFGSIVRRNYDEINRMNPEEKRHLIKELGMTESYYSELNKEIKGVWYDKGVR